MHAGVSVAHGSITRAHRMPLRIVGQTERARNGAVIADQARTSPLRDCLRGARPFRPARNAAPTALWSAPGSGNTWLRLLIEYSTGLATGSVYADGQLAAVMPSEGWPTATRADCRDMIALKTHAGLTDHAASPTAVCGGAISRAIFLVRHPFAAAWAEFQRSVFWRSSQSHAAAVSELPPASSQGFWKGWHHFATSFGRRWAELIDGDGVKSTPSGGHSFRTWARRGLAYQWLRYEDLQDPTRRELELLRVIGFVTREEHHPPPSVLRCAFEHASTNATRRASSAATRRAMFENSERTGSAVWRRVAPVARRFKYTRAQYMSYIASTAGPE